MTTIPKKKSIYAIHSSSRLHAPRPKRKWERWANERMEQSRGRQCSQKAGSRSTAVSIIPYRRGKKWNNYKYTDRHFGTHLDRVLCIAESCGVSCIGIGECINGSRCSSSSTRNMKCHREPKRYHNVRASTKHAMKRNRLKIVCCLEFVRSNNFRWLAAIALALCVCARHELMCKCIDGICTAQT